MLRKFSWLRPSQLNTEQEIKIDWFLIVFQVYKRCWHVVIGYVDKFSCSTGGQKKVWLRFRLYSRRNVTRQTVVSRNVDVQSTWKNFTTHSNAKPIGYCQYWFALRAKCSWTCCIWVKTLRSIHSSNDQSFSWIKIKKIFGQFDYKFQWWGTRSSSSSTSFQSR